MDSNPSEGTQGVHSSDATRHSTDPYVSNSQLEPRGTSQGATSGGNETDDATVAPSDIAPGEVENPSVDVRESGCDSSSAQPSMDVTPLDVSGSTEPSNVDSLADHTDGKSALDGNRGALPIGSEVSSPKEEQRQSVAYQKNDAKSSANDKLAASILTQSDNEPAKPLQTSGSLSRRARKAANKKAKEDAANEHGDTGGHEDTKQPHQNGSEPTAAEPDTQAIQHSEESTASESDKKGKHDMQYEADKLLNEMGRYLRSKLKLLWESVYFLAYMFRMFIMSQVDRTLKYHRATWAWLKAATPVQLAGVMFSSLFFIFLLGDSIILGRYQPRGHMTYNCLAEVAGAGNADVEDIMRRCRVDYFATYAHVDQVKLLESSEAIVNQCYSLSEAGSVLNTVIENVNTVYNTKATSQKIVEDADDAGMGTDTITTKTGGSPYFLAMPELYHFLPALQPLTTALNSPSAPSGLNASRLVSHFRDKLLAFSKAHGRHVWFTDQEIAAVTRSQQPWIFDTVTSAVRRTERGDREKWRVLARFYDRAGHDISNLHAEFGPDLVSDGELLASVNSVDAAAANLTLDPRFRSALNQAARSNFIARWLYGRGRGARSDTESAYGQLDSLVALVDDVHRCAAALHDVESVLYRLRFRAEYGRFLSGGAAVEWIRQKYPEDFSDERAEQHQYHQETSGIDGKSIKYTPPRWPWSERAERNNGVPLFRGLAGIEGIVSAWDKGSKKT